MSVFVEAAALGSGHEQVAQESQQLSALTFHCTGNIPPIVLHMEKTRPNQCRKTHAFTTMYTTIVHLQIDKYLIMGRIHR